MQTQWYVNKHFHKKNIEHEQSSHLKKKTNEHKHIEHKQNKFST